MLQMTKAALKRVPLLGPALVRLRGGSGNFQGSARYWEQRYRNGGNSGAGSYGPLAQFKASVLNGFVAQHGVGSVIEFGCGDGAQLELASYPSYIGVDVSPKAIAICRDRFAADSTKRFLNSAALPAGTQADLSLSLDVIYHLVEDPVFDAYMRQLFAAGRRFVGVYSSNMDSNWAAKHVRHRAYAGWIATNAGGWSLHSHIPNAYPYDPTRPDETSFADFRFYARH